MPLLEINTKGHVEFVDISARVQSLVPAMKSGICHVFSLHTTAGLTINENADPDVVADIISSLEKIVPWKNSMYRHAEGNSAAHVKASLMGASLSIPIDNGQLRLGPWQAVYFCEFDGPRRRGAYISFIEVDS